MLRESDGPLLADNKGLAATDPLAPEVGPIGCRIGKFSDLLE